MTPKDLERSQRIGTLAEQGRYVEAVNAQLTYLEERALEISEVVGIKCVVNEQHAPPTQAEAYLMRGEAIADAIEHSEAKGTIDPERVAHWILIREIYLGIGYYLQAIASLDVPDNGNRIAHFTLKAMNLAYLSQFCAELDQLDERAKTQWQAHEYERFMDNLARHNAEQSKWHPDALIAYAAYMHFNPSAKKFAAESVAVDFVKDRTGLAFSTHAVAKAKARGPGLYEAITKAVSDAVAQRADQVPEAWRDSIAAALAKFGPK